MANTQLIDQLVDPAALAQIENLKAELNGLGISFTEAATKASALYKATGNSTTYTEFVKNNKAAADSIDQMSKAQENARLAEIRLQQAREKAFDDYEKKLQKQADAVQAATDKQNSIKQKQADLEDKLFAKKQAAEEKAAQKEQQILDKQQQQADKAAAADAKRQAKAQADADKAAQKELDRIAKVDAANGKAADKQAQRDAVSNRPFKQLEQRRNDAIKNAQDIGAALGVESQAFKDAQEHANSLDSAYRGINEKLGKYQENVGNYSSAFDRLGRILESRIFRLAASFIFTDLAIKGISALYEVTSNYVKEIIYLNSTLDESKERFSAFQDAAKSGDYAKGVESVLLLGDNIELAKNKISEQSKVVDEYNKTIGTVTGSVDSFTAAEKGFQENSDKYINAILNQAAAQSLLAKASEDVAKVLEVNQEKQSLIIRNNQAIKDLQTKGSTTVNTGLNATGGGTVGYVAIPASQQIQTLKKENENLQGAIDDNNKKLRDRIKDRQNIVKGILGSDAGVTDATGGGNGVTDIDKLLNDNANKAIEIDKKIQQSIIENEENSYIKRIIAVKKYRDDDYQIAENNRALELKANGLSAEQKKGIERSYQLARIDAKQAADKKIDDFDKQNIEKQLQKVKEQTDGVLKNDNATYEQKLDAIRKFQTDSDRLINKSPLSRQTKDNMLLGISNQSVQDMKEAQDKQSELVRKGLEDLLKMDQDAADRAVAIVTDQGADEIAVMQKSRDQQARDLETKLLKGKISEQSYRDQLLLIDDQYNIQRLQKELETDQKILAIRQSEYNNALADAQGNESAVPDNIKKGVKAASDKVNADNLALGNANFKLAADTTKTQQDTAIEAANKIGEAVQDLQQIQSEASKAIQAGYQAEIDQLEKRKDLIQETANVQIAAVNASIASEKSKSDQIALINARTKAQQDAITQQENKVKKREAELEKDANISSIVENIAVAETKALAQGGGLFGIPLAAIVGALGAVQLAVAIAQPLPAYAKGTKSAKGGLSIVGELGKEWVTTPSGHSFFTPPSATLMNIPKGSEVLNAMETKRLQANGTLPTTGDKSDDMLNELRRGNDIAAKNAKRKPQPNYGWPARESAAWQAYERRIFR